MTFSALLLDKDDAGSVTATMTDLEDERLPDGEVTVDVEYSSLNYKDGMILQGIGGLVRTYPHVPGIDLAGTLLFLLPFCVVGVMLSWEAVANSWSILESSPDPGGLPRYPVKTLLPLGLALLGLQGLAQIPGYLRTIRGEAS